MGTSPSPVLLLHGYGSSAREWLPFTKTIVIDQTRRFVFPEGPETTRPPEGPVGGRAWWPLNLTGYANPTAFWRELSTTRPAGLDISSNRIRLLIEDLQIRLTYPRSRLILGGFSQGAMIALDIAIRTEEPLGALVLLSATLVDEKHSIDMLRNRRGLRVFISHGRQDNVLTFGSGERLQRAMRDAGMYVTWVPFDGGHEIPATVVAALNQFLNEIDR